MKKTNFCSKISIEKYEYEKNESKQHLIKLLYSILTNVSMTQEDKIKRLKQVTNRLFILDYSSSFPKSIKSLHKFSSFMPIPSSVISIIRLAKPF